jgi:hypothetical protein
MYTRSEYHRTSCGYLRVRYEQPSWAYGARWYWVYLGGTHLGTVERIASPRGWTIKKGHDGLPRTGIHTTRREATLSLLKAAGYND